jgi:hypothetical protein
MITQQTRTASSCKVVLFEVESIGSNCSRGIVDENDFIIYNKTVLYILEDSRICFAS